MTTGVLAATAAPEPTIESVRVAGAGEARWLRTSPEAALKSLLAAGSGDIFEIGPVFRANEHGRAHRVEFTLLEWYRTGFDHHRLMAEVEALLGVLGHHAPVQRLSYTALWRTCLPGDPHTASDSELADLARAAGAPNDGEDRAALLDRLYVAVLEPELARAGTVLLYDYPAALRAYARLSGDVPPVAQRFELVIDGLEIANGYHEVTDAAEQRACFEAENALRRGRGLAPVVPDPGWLAALEAGLPPCAGVALGIERLLMALGGVRDIADLGLGMNREVEGAPNQ